MTVGSSQRHTIVGSHIRPEVAMKPAPERRLTASDTVRIEVALSRGVSARDVMAIWGLTYRQLQTIRDRMASA